MFDVVQIGSTVRKYITKKDLFFLGFIVVLFLLTRLVNIDKLPIFSDEGIYIHWAKTAWHDANWRFISLTDGKQPLQTWFTIPFLKLFPDNMLLGGRLFATMCGFICLTGIMNLCNFIFGKKAALWGAIFYIFTPYFMFYDRLALVDSGVNAAFIWILFFSLWLVRNCRLDVALVFGIVSGFGLLAKSSVSMFMGLAVIAPLVIYNHKNKKEFIHKSVNYLILFAIATSIAVAMYNVQRLSPYMHIIAEKNKIFIMTFHDFARTPFQNFFGNIRYIPWYVFQESAYILPLLGIVGFIILFRVNRKLFSYLVLWIVIPFFIVAFLSIVIYPRYLIFMPTLLSITAAFAISNFKDKKKVFLLAAAFFISVAYFDYTILFAPQNMPLPPVDRAQYIEDWTAGWGIKEIVVFAREKSLTKPVVVLAEGNFGMSSDSLESLLKRSDEGKIQIWGRWPLNLKQLKDAQFQLKDKYVYVVFSHTNNVPTDWPIKLIRSYKKPGNISIVYLYQLLP